MKIFKNFCLLVLAANVLMAEQYAQPLGWFPFKKPKKCEPAKKVEPAPFYLSPTCANKDCKIDVIVSGSYLYYWPIQKDLEVAQIIPSSPSTSSYQEKLLNTKFHSGFKVGFGFSSNHDHWLCFAEYTRLYSTDTSKYTLPSNASGMNEYWTLSDLTTNYSRTSWKLMYDLVSLDISRPSYFGKKLKINPYFGLKGGKIDQRLDANATQLDQTKFYSLYTSDSWLIGPRAGVESNWFLSKHFSVNSDFNVNIMYQNFDVKAQNKNLSNASLDRSNRYTPRSTTTNLNLGLGFAYGREYSTQNRHFDVVVSYDFYYYLGQNMLKRIRAVNFGAEEGDLMIQALNVTLRLDF